MNELALQGGSDEEWLQSLKERITGAQARAILAVNREMVLLYWQPGREIAPSPVNRLPSSPSRPFGMHWLTKFRPGCRVLPSLDLFHPHR